MSDFQHMAAVGWRTLREDGPRGVLRRATGVLHTQLGGSERGVELLPGDIVDSNSLHPSGVPPHLPCDSPLTVGWVSTPPGIGSGGHTTMFRMVAALEKAGHKCVIFVYDKYRGSLSRHEATIRRGWPDIRANVVDGSAGISGVDLCVATSWESAHVLAKRRGGLMRAAYFVQDFEPFFYPRGWQYELAEDSYRFGFRTIALGPMVAELLRTEIGIGSDLVEFGSDTNNYHIRNDLGPRNGVVFFARPGVARRGYQLGKAALDEFHKRYPDQTIHVFGSDARDLAFPVERHGVLGQAELNYLYNRVIAGVALSFTNVSLVPEEMLAGGVIPVCNESNLARACLTDPNVSWVPATPSGVADRLGELVNAEDIGARAARVAAAVRRDGWAASQDALVRIIEDEVYGSARP